MIHSATKFLSGHADAMGGVVCGRPELVEKVYHYREITGASLDPMAAYLIIRGMKTLFLRIRKQNESALKIAHWLQGHPAIEVVDYPGWRHTSTMKLPTARCEASVACSALCCAAASRPLDMSCHAFSLRIVLRTWGQSKLSSGRQPPPAT